MAPLADFGRKSSLASLIEAVSDFIAGPQAKWEDVPFAPGRFNHAGRAREGLAATRDLEAGEQLVSVPRALQVPSQEELGASRFRGIHAGPFFKSSIVLAERHRLWLAGRGQSLGIGPQSARVAVAQLESWPTLQQLRSQGIPLLAPPEELDALRGLPGVESIPLRVDTMKQDLLRSFEEYLQDQDCNNQVTWEDVLWGAAISLSKIFQQAGDKATLAPVADAFGHADSNATPNTEWAITSDGPLHFWTTRPVHKGEELTFDSMPSGEFGALYNEGAVVPADPRIAWAPSAADCSKLQALLLGPDNPLVPRKSGPLLANVRSLVQARCSGPDTAAVKAPEAAPEPPAAGHPLLHSSRKQGHHAAHHRHANPHRHVGKDAAMRAGKALMDDIYQPKQDLVKFL